MGVKWQLQMPLLFFSSLPDLATTMSQAIADTVHTEILPCARDHVQDHPTAVGPGNDACRVPGGSSHPGLWMTRCYLNPAPPQLIIRFARATGGG